jgi:hypothetical protein
METLRIRWIDSQDMGDDFEQLKQSMEIGDDEGPIILLPVPQRGPGIRKATTRYPAQLFENPLWLVAYLFEHADDLNTEVWLGICEVSTRSQAATATSGAWYFKQLINDLGGMNRRSRVPAKAKKNSAKFANMTHWLISEPPLPVVDIIIENTGEAFEEIAEAFDKLPRSVMISRR